MKKTPLLRSILTVTALGCLLTGLPWTARLVMAQNVLPSAPVAPVAPAAPAESALPDVPAAAPQPDAAASAAGQAPAPASAPDKTAGGAKAEAFLRLQQDFGRKKELWKPQTSLGDFKSLLFTDWQQALIKDAIQRYNEKPTEEEQKAKENGAPALPDANGQVRGGDNMAVKEVDQLDNIGDKSAKAVEKKVAPGIRELQLGGIMYQSAKDWVVWLNGFRVTPGALPDRVIDLAVHDDYIDLVWFDEYTNLVYPIRLRPHQRFNLDSRIYLPGVQQNN